jgi:hypothetical protein
MTDTRFIAEYELILGRPRQLNNYIIPQTLVNPAKVKQGVNGVRADGVRFSTSPDGTTLENGDYLDYNSIPPKFWAISDLHVTAEIAQTKEQGTPCRITVYNLDDEITDFLRRDDLIIFRAGYRQPTGAFVQTFAGEMNESLPDLFVGQIQRISTTFDDTDKVTVIDCSEGQTVRRNSRISYSWPPLTTRQKVVQDMLNFLKKQGMPTGQFILPANNTLEYERLQKPYLSGYTVQGNTMEELEKLCKAFSLHCYVVLGKVYVEPARVTQGLVVPSTDRARRRLVYTVTPDNVKGQLEVIDGDSNPTPSNANGRAQQQGVGLTTYLDGRISVSQIMRLQDFEDFDGDYEITSVKHKYSHREAGCETIVTLKRLSNG